MTAGKLAQTRGIRSTGVRVQECSDAARLHVLIIISIVQGHDTAAHGCKYHRKLLGRWCVLA
eukprot:2476872-Alexandrium_andersonii.AAC.1